MSPSHPQPAPRAAGPRGLALEGLLYALVALVAVSGARGPGRVIGDGVDLYGTFWFYWWIQRCIELWQDPGFTDLMFYPLGKDIFAHTGSNFVDAALAWPLQRALGYPDYQPAWVAVVLVGNALAFRPLAGDLLRTRAAAVTATVLWQICPYILFELMTGRVTQAFLWFLPLAVRSFLHIGGVDERARLPGAAAHGPRWRDPVLAGALTALQAWTYWFMGYFMALLFAWLALVELARRPGRGARAVGYLGAAGVALAGVAPALWAMARKSTAGLVPGLSEVPDGGVLEAPPLLANNVAQHLHGYWLMETQGQPMFGYVLWGAGTLLAAALAADRARWVGALLLSLAFALGPQLPVGGGIPMPHYLLAYHFLPFFDRLWFPVRLVSVSMFAATLLLGQLVDRAEAWRGRRLLRLPVFVLPALVVGLGMVEQHRVLAFPLLSRDLTPPQVYRVIGAHGGGLIELPIGMARISIAWQPVHGQPTFGGMAENAPVFHPPGFRQRMANSFILYLRRVTRDPDRSFDYDAPDLAALVAEGFRWVVLDRQLLDSEITRGSFSRRMPPQVVDRAPFYAQDNLVSHLGPPVMAEERLVVWDLVGGAQVPPELVPTAEDLQVRTWPKKEMPAYEALMRARGRIRDAPEAPPEGRPGAAGRPGP
ncbi:hypothetical protein L6R53_04440 [Myxococcota bacterium]|nr:hypothetical protein [Myxococcota bacterium]